MSTSMQYPYNKRIGNLLEMRCGPIISRITVVVSFDAAVHKFHLTAHKFTQTHPPLEHETSSHT
jgi:hypothetical protein